jgi:hypothetical protein
MTGWGKDNMQWQCRDQIDDTRVLGYASATAAGRVVGEQGECRWILIYTGPWSALH